MVHNEIVQKLWNLCHVLRDSGINYPGYVTELALLDEANEQRDALLLALNDEGEK